MMEIIYIIIEIVVKEIVMTVVIELDTAQVDVPNLVGEVGD